MIADRPHPQTLPLLPAFLCVLGAGWATSLVWLLQGPWAIDLGRVADPRLAQLVLPLTGALLGAWALRLLLRAVCGFSIPYLRAYGALVAGDLLSSALTAALLGTTPTLAVPALLGPGLVGIVVSVYLVQRFATSIGHRAPVLPVDEVARPRAGARDRYDEAVSAARDASIGLTDLALGVSPAEAPQLIANGLPALELATRSLEQQTCPIEELADCHQRLVHALEQLGDDLVEAAQEAGRSASDHLPVRGALFPSMADVSDHGARYRWSLSQSAGLKAVRDALEEMGRRGIGTTW